MLRNAAGELFDIEVFSTTAAAKGGTIVADFWRQAGMESRLYALTPAQVDDFKLRAIYGNVALATDHTVIKSLDANGKLVSREIRALRMFVNENGKWKVAGAALVPIMP